jgi:hypothetical protein
MTRDDIIRLMEWHPSFDRNQTDGLLARIERVAQAAAAAEREACAKVADEADKYNRHISREIAAAIRARSKT